MRINSPTRSVLVLYGSETGNAHDLAEELGRTTQRLHFSTEVLPLDSVEPHVLNEYSVVLISISTTGQGDLPANSRSFWKKCLRKKLSSTYLAGTRLGVFGLGDTSYPQYNWAALKVHKRLRQLGATDIVERGEGDEQHPEGYDAAFVPWTQSLKQKLSHEFPLPADIEPIPEEELLQPPWLLDRVSMTNGGGEVSHPDVTGVEKSVPQSTTPSATRSFEVLLEKNERVTALDHFQDVRHFAFSTAEKLSYLPGDILSIYPENMAEDVDQMLSVLGWSQVADEPVEFRQNQKYTNPRLPAKPSFFSAGKDVKMVTLRQLLTSQLDFIAIPRRSFFSLVAHFTNDKTQKERLLEFANPELIDELFDYTTRPRRSILEVLQEFDTLSIPWQWAATIFPELRGRQFSIASGGILKQPGIFDCNGTSTGENGTKFELLIAIVKYRTVIKKIRRGVCTRYLEGLTPGAKLTVTLARGALGINFTDLEKPVVMIGPGTGLAPIRALIWQRYLWAQAQEAKNDTVSATKPGPMVLLFGCRNKDADYFFREEWPQLQDRGVPLTVFAAFSRDQAKKIYVQDLIREQDELLYDVLHNRGGIVFVCGSSGRMPQAVRSALLDVLQQGAGTTPEGAEDELKAMEKQGRYKQETW